MTTADPTVSSHRTPDLSVILVAREGFEVIRKTILHLAVQTARERMELVIVAPAAAAAALGWEQCERWATRPWPLDARTYHLNVTLPSVFILEHIYVGRVFAAHRARQWSLARRMLAIFTTPLIPLRRVFAVLRDIRVAGRQRELLPGVLPAVLVGLTCRAVGELAGYVLGAGVAMQRLSEYEFDRMRYLSRADRVSASLFEDVGSYS